MHFDISTVGVHYVEWLVCLAGALVFMVGLYWMVVLAFKRSLQWGVGCLFFLPLVFVFAVRNPELTKGPFITCLAGVVVGMVGIFFFVLSGGLSMLIWTATGGGL
jgi:hypothetical protein